MKKIVLVLNWAVDQEWERGSDMACSSSFIRTSFQWSEPTSDHHSGSCANLGDTKCKFMWKGLLSKARNRFYFNASCGIFKFNARKHTEGLHVSQEWSSLTRAHIYYTSRSQSCS